MNDLTSTSSDFDRLLPFVERVVISGIPVKELNISTRDKNRLKAIFRTWQVYQQNPFVHVRERLASERNYISPDFLPTAIQLFEHIRTNCDEFTSKNDKHLCLWGARQSLKIAAQKSDPANINRAVKQLAELNDGFQEQDDNSKSRAALPIVLVHATKINPESLDYTDAALEEEMRKWNAAIDPSFAATQQRSRQLEARSLSLEDTGGASAPTPSTVPSAYAEGGASAPTPSYLTDDIFQEYD